MDKSSVIDRIDASASRLLRRAKELIATPQQWCKRVYGDSWGRAFCSYGALDWAAAGDGALFTRVWDKYLCPSAPTWNCPISFNDLPDTTHEDVLLMFDRAIALAEKDEGRESDSAYAARMVREIVGAMPAVAVAVVKA